MIVRILTDVAIMMTLSTTAAQNTSTDVLNETIRILTTRSWVVGTLPESTWRSHVNTAITNAERIGVNAAVSRLIDAIGDEHSFRDVGGSCRAWFAPSFTPVPAIPIVNEDENEVKDAVVVPGSDRIQSVPAESLDDGVGRSGLDFDRIGDWVVVRVPNFDSTEVVTTLYEAVRLNAGLVVDLRGSPGGTLAVMSQASGLLSRGWVWWVTQRGRLGFPLGNPFGSPPHARGVIILVDSGTQSAAEAFAGGLQWRGDALVVGERTAGNTDVITPHCLPDDSTLWVAEGLIFPMTTARHPGWHKSGVVPDIVLDDVSEAMTFLRVHLPRIPSDTTPTAAAFGVD